MRITFMLFLSLIFVSCASSSSDKKNPFDPLTLEKLLVVGKTPQTQVLKELGSPNIVSKSSREGEVWTYTRMSYDSSEVYGDVGLSVIGALASGWFIPSASVGGGNNSSSSNSMDLVLSFDLENTLSDFSILKTKY